MADPVVATCATCGTAYTSRAWPWLESLGVERRGGLDADVRQCAVPGCGARLMRTSELTRAVATERAEAANDTTEERRCR